MALPVLERPISDPSFGDKPGPYYLHPLADVCGTRENPDAAYLYHGGEITPEASWIASATPGSVLGDWLRQLHSFDSHAEINQPDADEWPLSGVIGNVWPTKVKGRPFPFAPGTYLIDYQHLASRPGKPPTKAWVNELRSFFPEGSTLLLGFFGGKRELTTSLWAQRGFWDEAFLDQFDAIIGPDFGSYCNLPTPQIFIGERMQQIFLTEGAEAGHVVIPMISWSTEESLRRQVELWASRPESVNTVLLNCYASEVNPTAWRQRWLAAMHKYLAPHRHIRWIITGMTPGWAIRELNEIFDGNYCLVPSYGQFIAAQRSAVDADLMGRRYQRHLEKLEDFRTGRVVAPALELPDGILTFQQCRV
jgi:hypothetical protein